MGPTNARMPRAGRSDDLSPEVVLGHAQGRPVGISRRRRVFRLRQVTRTMRRQGQIRLHHFGLYIDPGLWGHTVEVLIYDDRLRMEGAERLLVSYPCGYDTRQRRITAIAHAPRHPGHQRPALQLVVFALEIVRMVWRMPLYYRAPWPRQALQARQLALFGHFTSEIGLLGTFGVQIRGHDARMVSMRKRPNWDAFVDPAIAHAVKILNQFGIQTDESCQGGEGHSYPEPPVRFYGNRYKGVRAFTIARQHGLRVTSLRRI
jgi:hypothetical protein